MTPMVELTQDLSLAQAHSLISSYAFDLGSDDTDNLFEYWLDIYHASWIRLATIEALYLGRYKAISIEHILNVWLRLGSPNPHFTYEFERLICRKLPKHLCGLSDMAVDIPTKEINSPPTNQDFEATMLAFSPASKSSSMKLPDLEEDTLNLAKAFGQVGYKNSTLPLVSVMKLSQDANWSEFSDGQKMIHQFIPLPDVSSFFNRLKTFGESK